MFNNPAPLHDPPQPKIWGRSRSSTHKIVSGAQGSRSLRSAEKGILVVPFARTASMQNRSFSVAGPRVWNDLPQELRLFPRLCTDTFLGHLKTYLFVRTGV